MRKTSTPLYMLRQVRDPIFDSSRQKLTTHEHFKQTIEAYHEQSKKSKSKIKKKSSSKKQGKENKIKRPGSSLGLAKHNKIRSTSGKSKHLRKNDSLYLEKFKSKQNTLRNIDSHIKAKSKNIKNASKSSIKINGIEKIVDFFNTGVKSKKEIKKFKKIESTIDSLGTLGNNELSKHFRSNNNPNSMSKHYALLSKNPHSGHLNATCNQSIERSEVYSELDGKNTDMSSRNLKNYSTISNNKTNMKAEKSSENKIYSLVRSKQTAIWKNL